jgi:hypothetical protein
MFVAVLSVTLLALAPGGMLSPSVQLLPGGGGPDSFGYRYLDSDTSAPGAPTYNWVSIKGVGTEITTLGDDNSAGPFPIGFEFPYYWYGVDEVIVGSNGYITFGDKSANNQVFNSVPSRLKPNDQLAVMLTDLDASDTVSTNGSIWYWSNGADSFIVEYDSIAFWSTGGSNTFQVILTKADSSITFQYKEQNGTPYNGWASENAQTGIENVSGQVGLNYLSGATPPGNAIHADLAVRFFPPETTALQIHDAGVRNAMNDNNGGVFAIRDRPLSFWAVVQNYGNQSEGEYKTFFRVQRTNGSVLFSDSMTAGATDPGETESLALASTWRPSTNGTYVIKVYTKLAGDMVPVNDTATLELRVVTMPATLTYDSGTPTGSTPWLGAGGMGACFIPPVYPCSISAIRQYMTSTSGSVNALMAIYDDDGSGGRPGTVLFGDTVTVTAGDWYEVTLPTPVVIDDGTFYVGAFSEVSGDPSFGYDDGLPISNQSWENTGAWGPSRWASTQDVCANAVTSGPVGIFEVLRPAPAPMPARIDVNPNPSGGMTTIRLLNPTGLEKSIELYDATGSIVRTLGLSRGQGVLDGRLLSDGIYFVRVVGAEAPVAKVIVTH